MNFITLVIMSMWLGSKLFGTINSKVELNNIEKYKTFESFRKK